MDFVGCVKEVFVIHWACLFGQASGGGETRCWPSNYVGVKDIGTWDLEGFVGNLVVWVLWLRHGHLPPFSLPHLFQSSYFQHLLMRCNRICPFLGPLRSFRPQIPDLQSLKACNPPSSQNFIPLSPSPSIHLLLPSSSYLWLPMAVSLFLTHLLLEVASPITYPPSPFCCH